MKDAVTEAVKRVRDRMVDDGEAPDYRTINSGLCGDFADEVADYIENNVRGGREMDIAVYELANFIQVDPETGFAYDDGGPFDRDLILRNWPDFPLPEGVEWDDLDRLSLDCGFSAGTHTFVGYGDLFFDSEAPEGVKGFFELPFFKRVIAGWLADEEAQAAWAAARDAQPAAASAPAP